MFGLREKLFLAGFIVTFALAPCWSQIGGLQEPGLLGDTQVSGLPSAVSLKRTTSGIILGSVRTLNDKPVPNARIEVMSLAQEQHVTSQYTSQEGTFVVSVPLGNYELRAEAGVVEASARLRVNEGQNFVTLRMPNPTPAQAQDGNASTVSVQQLRVPEKAAAFLAKAHQAMDKSKLGEAARYVSKALAVFPEYAQALALRAILELQAQQFDQAAADAHRAIQTDPNYGAGYLVMGAALNCQKKFQEALGPLERSQTLLPNAWQGYFESAKALLQLGKFQDALQKANKASALGNPTTHPDLHLVKGYAYLGLYSYGAALTEFQQYISRVPDGPNTAQVRSTLEKIRPLAAAAVAR